MNLSENKQTKVVIGSDHAGFHLKEVLKKFLVEEGVSVTDFGTWSQESTDYPDIALEVALAVGNNQCLRGILICATGQGMCITANKIAGIRAALCHDTLSAKLSRAHNDSNILVLGGKIIGISLAVEIVKVWLNTEFEGGRHQRRLEKIKHIERIERRK